MQKSMRDSYANSMLGPSKPISLHFQAGGPVNGSSLILLKNVSKFCTTCAQKVKVDAGIYADDQQARALLTAAGLDPDEVLR